MRHAGSLGVCLPARVPAPNGLTRMFSGSAAPSVARTGNRPLRDYVTGPCLSGEPKGIEAMAARVDPRHVRARHQSIHHFTSARRAEEVPSGSTGVPPPVV